MRTVSVPKEGLEITVPEGKEITRIHLDLGREGTTLAMVGAASTAMKAGNRHKLQLKPGKDGVTLAVVGAASGKA